MQIVHEVKIIFTMFKSPVKADILYFTMTM